MGGATARTRVELEAGRAETSGASRSQGGREEAERLEAGPDPRERLCGLRQPEAVGTGFWLTRQGERRLLGGTASLALACAIPGPLFPALGEERGTGLAGGCRTALPPPNGVTV